MIAVVQGKGTLGLETLSDQSPDLAPIAAGAGVDYRRAALILLETPRLRRVHHGALP